MLINEVSKSLCITKKAIEYYIAQGLIHPAVMQNGYRDFNDNDLERLKKISLLRKLDLNVQDIKMILADETNDSLRKIALQKTLSVQREQAKKTALDKLCREQDYSALSEEVAVIEQSATITEKLLEAFPGYYGRFICLHFARFLTAPIKTEEERSAFYDIISFLDNMPPLAFPEDIQTFLDENSVYYDANTIESILDNTKKAIENPDAFFIENKEALDHYLEFKQSDDYKNSPLNKLEALLKEFNNSSGYYDTFIPAMKRLSKTYVEYCRQMESANDKLLLQYPELKHWNI